MSCMICPHCQSDQTTLILTPETQHYGKIVCVPCGNKWLKWQAFPIVSWRELNLPDPLPNGMFTPLRGTDKQIKWAESIRPTLVNRVRTIGADHIRLADAMSTIGDASWWIANRDSEVNKIAWPGSWHNRGRNAS